MDRNFFVDSNFCMPCSVSARLSLPSWLVSKDLNTFLTPSSNSLALTCPSWFVSNEW